ncbi:MAG: alpha/beta fold hydrolase [Solirubrobacterales bacterium]
MGVERRERDGVAYRETGPADAERVALCLHGYPTGSRLWEPTLEALAAEGWRAIAPDLPGFGRSEPLRPGTWHRQIETVETFRRSLGLDRVALCVHDWGGLIGLRWACDHPDAVRALVIADTGFFDDGAWNGVAQTLRTEGKGEELVDGLDRDGFGELLRGVSPGMPDEAIDEYWQAYTTTDRRRAQLELYRSGDFSELAAYQGCLAALEVPTLVLWGAKDELAPIGGGHRFHKQIPGSEMVVLDEAGHFLHHDEPERVASEIAAFLSTSAGT